MKRAILVLLFIIAGAGTARAQLTLPISAAGGVQAPIDFNGWKNFRVTLTQNVSAFQFTGIPTPAQANVTVIFAQNATGGFTVTYAPYSAPGGQVISITNGCAPTTMPLAVTVCQFDFDTTTSTWIGITSSGTGIPAGNSNDIQIKNGSGFGSGGPGSGNIANVGVLGNIFGKPNCTLSTAAVNDSMQWVSTNGSDTNDGCSWLSAVKDISTAYANLPGKGGTIYITGASNQSGGAVTCVQATPTIGQGLGIAGPTDTNYSSMPEVLNGVLWLQYKKVYLVGIPSNGAASSLNYGQVCVIMGGNTSSALQLSSDNGGFGMVNIASAGGSKRGLVIGEDSGGSRTGGAIWSGLDLENVSFTVSTSSTSNGPAVDCTGGSFQLYFKDISLSANSTATVGSNAQAALLMDGNNGVGGNDGCGLLTVRDSHFNNGGLKFVPGASTASFSIDGIICEAQLSGDSCINITNSSNLTAAIRNVDVADCTGNVAGVTVAPNGAVGNASDNVLVEQVNSGCTINNQGEMIGLGQYKPVLQFQSVSPTQQGQVGPVAGHIVGQVDAARRQVRPAAVRFANILNPPSGYTITAGGTLTTGITAPDGTSNAVQGAYASASGGIIFLNSNTVPIAVSNIFIAGVWVRSQTANGYAGGTLNVMQLSVSGSGNTTSTLIQHGAPWLGDGEWEWVWQAQKITAAVTSPAIVQMNVQYDSTHTVQAYGPVLLQIPAGTLSQNEIFDLAYNLESFSPACSVGQLCGVFPPPAIDCTRYFGADASVQINACVAAVIAQGGGIADARGFYGTQTISQEITVGNSSHVKVTLLLPTWGTWTTTAGITNPSSTVPGTCAMFEWGQSRIESQGPVLGLRIANGSGNGVLDALFCHEALSGGTYFYVKGVNFYNTVYTTSSGGTFLSYGADDTSVFEDLQVDDYLAGDTGAILLTQTASVSGDCCSATFNRIQTNAQFTGPPGVNINGTSTGDIVGVVFNNSSFTHPKAGSPAILCSDTNATHASTVTFNGTYEETSNSDTTTPINQVNGCGSVAFTGGLTIRAQVAADVAPAVSISSAFASSVTIDNLTLENTWTLPNTSAIQTNVTSAVCPAPPCNFPSNSHGNVSRYSSNITYADFTATGRLNQTAAGQYAGTCTLGTNCAITFGAAYISTPVCTGADQTNIQAIKMVPTTTGVTITGNATDVIAWHCIGNPN